MEEFIPTFEKEENNLLVRIDEFEDQIKLINKLSKDYENLKKEIKREMVEIGKNNNLDQVKWTTPKGIQITCSIGHPAEFEEVTERAFSLETLMKDYPEVYEKCCYDRTYNKNIKSATSDRLVITLPKEVKND